VAQTPNLPEHADKIEAIPGADPRFTLRRHLTGYAYPQNGNVHNPTPRYTWVLLLDGRIIDQDPRRGPLVHEARINGASYLAG
jgi:hypothetical protein